MALNIKGGKTTILPPRHREPWSGDTPGLEHQHPERTLEEPYGSLNKYQVRVLEASESYDVWGLRLRQVLSPRKHAPGLRIDLWLRSSRVGEPSPLICYSPGYLRLVSLTLGRFRKITPIIIFLWHFPELKGIMYRFRFLPFHCWQRWAFFSSS